MGKCFSDAVETALRYIYYDVRLGKGAEGLELLKKASAEGDGDVFVHWLLVPPYRIMESTHTSTDLTVTPVFWVTT